MANNMVELLWNKSDLKMYQYDSCVSLLMDKGVAKNNK